MKIEVVIDNQSYTVEIEDINARPVIANVHGERFEVWPQRPDETAIAHNAPPTIALPEAGAEMGIGVATEVTSGGKNVLSPLPGVIVAILVKPGEEVIRGQELCTLEAMKMKNAIRSSRDGIIDSIEVGVGDQVNHGQVLITYAE
jgi:biotin carboxyl carrier protein